VPTSCCREHASKSRRYRDNEHTPSRACLQRGVLWHCEAVDWTMLRFRKTERTAQKTPTDLAPCWCEFQRRQSTSGQVAFLQAGSALAQQRINTVRARLCCVTLVLQSIHSACKQGTNPQPGAGWCFARSVETVNADALYLFVARARHSLVVLQALSFGTRCRAWTARSKRFVCSVM